jgi:predicted ATPase
MYVDRFIFTGPPGAGKTTLLQHLAHDGFAIAAEAATDLIATKHRQGVDEPWKDPSFIDAIARLQEERRVALGGSTRIQLYDRSPICTVALANWLGHPIPDGLNREIECMLREQIYRTEVFFVESLGFVTPTESRRIDLADSIRFGELHQQPTLFMDSDLFASALHQSLRGCRPSGKNWLGSAPARVKTHIGTLPRRSSQQFPSSPPAATDSLPKSYDLLNSTEIAASSR